MRVFSEFCGPDIPGWKSNPKATAQHATDQACKEHDEEYGKLGPQAYTHWNEADQKLLLKLRSIKPRSSRERIIRKTAIVFFTNKKRLNPWIGSISGESLFNMTIVSHGGNKYEIDAWGNTKRIVETKPSQNKPTETTTPSMKVLGKRPLENAEQGNDKRGKGISLLNLL